MLIKPSLAGEDVVESLEAGIDWVTYVQPIKKESGALLQFGERMVTAQAARGSKIRPFRAEGYFGWSAENCAYGSRKDSEYLRLSGNLAALHWCEIPSSSGRPSRLDVQITLLLKESDNAFGSRVLRERATEKYPKQGRPPIRSYSKDSAGLWLGAVGTRTSRAYLRVYDKGIEARTHTQGKRWRVELEAKKSLAHQLWSEVNAAADCELWCCEAVVRACQNVGSLIRELDDSTLSPLPAVPQKNLQSTARTLEWFRQSVAPAIARVAHEISTEVLLECLGMSELALSTEQVSRMA